MGATSGEQSASFAIPGAAARIFGSPVRTFIFIFLLSSVVRAAPLALWCSNHADSHRLGGEMGRVALSLMCTGRFADPYMIPTGPTAHPTPLSPALLALTYHAFGMTAAAGYACALIPTQGLGEGIGLGITLHAPLAIALVFIAFLSRWTADRPSAAGAALLGLAGGAALHVVPPLLLVLLGNLILDVWWNRGRRRWLHSAWVAAGAILACLPCAWRNYTTLHGFLSVRSNFGPALRIASHPGADAHMDATWARNGPLGHLRENLAEARQVQNLREAEYNRRATNETFTRIRTHSAEAWHLKAMRLLHFWCGRLRFPWLAALFTAVMILVVLGLCRTLPALGVPRRAALSIPLAALPLGFFIVSNSAHYPVPLALMLLPLAGAEFRHWNGRKAMEV